MFRRTLYALAVVLLIDWLPGVPPFPEPVPAAGQIGVCTDFFYTSGTAAGNVNFAAQAAARPGLFFYPTIIEAHMIANAAVTGAAPAGVINTTGLVNNLFFTVDNSSLTIGQAKQIVSLTIPFGTMRTTAPNVAYSLTYNGSGQATYNIRVNLAGCYAP